MVENNADWTASATKEQINDARQGNLTLKFFEKEVPKEWFADIRGKKVLCLAGAGGLQAPLLACAGADVTVIDISNKMLEKDQEIAIRENLRDEQGGYYKAVYRMPFCSKDYDNSDWIEYGHTMEDYLGGMIEVGVVINGYVECQMKDITQLQFMCRFTIHVLQLNN